MAGAGDVVRTLAGAGGGLLHASRNLARRRILLFDRSRNGGGDGADLADGVADAANRRDAIAGGGLDRADLACDLFGGFRGLAGEVLDLGVDHRTPSPGFAGARRLDGCIERQEISL